MKKSVRKSLVLMMFGVSLSWAGGIEKTPESHHKTITHFILASRQSPTIHEVLQLYAKNYFGSDLDKAIDYLEKHAPGLLKSMEIITISIKETLRVMQEHNPKIYEEVEKNNPGHTRAIGAFRATGVMPRYAEKKDSKK